MKHFLLLVITLFAFEGFTQTSWTGITSTDWNNTANWTAGVPGTGTNVIIGDASFTGSFQPRINSSVANCNNLTIGNGAIACSLTLAHTINIKWKFSYWCTRNTIA